MLREIITARTHSQGYRRRWFQDEKLDLYTWHTETGGVLGFQLAYDKLSAERVITWIRDRGFFHARIDEGIPGIVAGSEFLVPDDQFDCYRVHSEFLARAREMDEEIALLVSRKLREYLTHARGGSRPAGRTFAVAVIFGIALGLVLSRL